MPGFDFLSTSNYLISKKELNGWEIVNCVESPMGITVFGINGRRKNDSIVLSTKILPPHLRFRVIQTIVTYHVVMENFLLHFSSFSY